jgi:hypothetical protein
MDETVEAVLESTVRRRVVDLLVADEGRTDVGSLAARVSAADGARRPTEEYGIELHHVHLPKLADAGLVRWDREAVAVEATRTARRIADRPDAPVGRTVTGAHGDD